MSRVDGPDAFERRYAVHPFSILPEIPYSALRDQVLLSGSLVDGFGNRGSDIDIVVVAGSAPPPGRQPFFLRSAGRWVDVEAWGRTQLDALTMRGRQASEIPGNLADYAPLRYHQAVSLHRFSIAIGLTSPPPGAAPPPSLEPCRHRLAQAAYHLMTARNLWQDAAGAFASSQPEDTSYMAAMGLERCFDAWAALAGETNPNEKWRAAKHRRLAANASGPLPIGAGLILHRRLGTAAGVSAEQGLRSFATALFDGLCAIQQKAPAGPLPQPPAGWRYEIVHDTVYRVGPDTTMVPVGGVRSIGRTMEWTVSATASSG